MNKIKQFDIFLSAKSRQYMQALLWWLYSKTRREVKVVAINAKPDISTEAIKIVAFADYTYLLPKTTIKSDRSGDTYAECSFEVMFKGTEIGTMTIWHNRYGANAHFNETRKYPLS